MSKSGNIFEVPSGQPRLSGALSYGPPFPWAIRAGGGSIRITANAKSTKQLVLYFVLLGGCSPLVLYHLFAHYQAISNDWRVVLFAAILPSIPLIIAAICLYQGLNRNLKEGPWFYFSSQCRKFEFPRYSLSLSVDQIVRWELIFGCWVRADDGSAIRFGDDISELQLVFLQNGKLMSLPLLGALGKHGLDHAAMQIADATKIPLERIIDNRSFRNPYALRGL